MSRSGWLLFGLAALAASPAAAEDGEEQCGYSVGRHGSAELAPACERDLAAMGNDKDRADLLFQRDGSGKVAAADLDFAPQRQRRHVAQRGLAVHALGQGKQLLAGGFGIVDGAMAQLHVAELVKRVVYRRRQLTQCRALLGQQFRLLLQRFVDAPQQLQVACAPALVVHLRVGAGALEIDAVEHGQGLMQFALLVDRLRLRQLPARDAGSPAARTWSR